MKKEGTRGGKGRRMFLWVVLVLEEKEEVILLVE